MVIPLHPMQKNVCPDAGEQEWQIGEIVLDELFWIKSSQDIYLPQKVMKS